MATQAGGVRLGDTLVHNEQTKTGEVSASAGPGVGSTYGATFDFLPQSYLLPNEYLKAGPDSSVLTICS